MSKTKTKSIIDEAAARLRTIVLATKEGELLGSEETLIGKLEVSRATVRQVARLLEREGLLRVRRGINGGYFAGRPDKRTIESIVSSYLEVVHTNPEDITNIASVLWVEVIRKAARLKTPEALALATKYSARVRAVKADASFQDILDIEIEIRAAIFELINSGYIELIFQINTAFSRAHFMPSSAQDGTEFHRTFVHDWRNSKLLEFGSIADADVELAAIAARHSRNIWHRRIWKHDMA